jgi:hypothetical protein
MPPPLIDMYLYIQSNKKKHPPPEQKQQENPKLGDSAVATP